MVEPGISSGELPEPTGDWEHILELGDVGAGERLAWHLRDAALYLGDGRGFAWWTGQYWDTSSDADDRVLRYVLRSMRRITGQALKIIEERSQLEPKKMERIRREALKRAGSLAACRSAIDVMKVHPAIQADPDTMDAHWHMVNVANGVLDLSRGKAELLPHDPKWRLTACSPFPWDPSADMTVWERFVDQIMCGDEDLIRFLQRAAGWTILGEGSRRTKAFIFLYGLSNSGKGVFTRSLARVLGRSQSLTMPFASIGEAALNAPNSSLSQAEGKRLLIVADTGSRPRWDGEVLKALTGGDWVSCSEKHMAAREFMPVGSLWLCANDKPIATGAGKEAVFQRCRLVPCRQEFSQDPEKIRLRLALPMDPDLEQELSTPANGKGALRWMVEGALSYLEGRSLGTCDVVEQEMMEYREHSKSPLGEFVGLFLRTEFDKVEDGELAFELADWDDHAVTTHDLHHTFHTWCQAQGYSKDAGTPTRTSRDFHALAVNDSRLSRVRKKQWSQSVLTSKRTRAWRRVSWTREGMEWIARARSATSTARGG